MSRRNPTRRLQAAITLAVALFAGGAGALAAGDTPRAAAGARPLSVGMSAVFGGGDLWDRVWAWALRVWTKDGMGIDPNGGKPPATHTLIPPSTPVSPKDGGMIDPNGGKPPSTDDGGGIDPNGRPR
jgi:hypothetical protein